MVLFSPLGASTPAPLLVTADGSFHFLDFCLVSVIVAGVLVSDDSASLELRGDTEGKSNHDNNSRARRVQRVRTLAQACG